uniref:Uncharacterized protein n=1 Tax=viral metagenome TaxID=1070528 RepID=A0A6C0DRY4_9ZZZZ
MTTKTLPLSKQPKSIKGEKSVDKDGVCKAELDKKDFKNVLDKLEASYDEKYSAKLNKAEDKLIGSICKKIQKIIDELDLGEDKSGKKRRFELDEDAFKEFIEHFKFEKEVVGGDTSELVLRSSTRGYRLDFVAAISLFAGILLIYLSYLHMNSIVASASGQSLNTILDQLRNNIVDSFEQSGQIVYSNSFVSYLFMCMRDFTGSLTRGNINTVQNILGNFLNIMARRNAGMIAEICAPNFNTELTSSPLLNSAINSIVNTITTFGDNERINSCIYRAGAEVYRHEINMTIERFSSGSSHSQTLAYWGFRLVWGSGSYFAYRFGLVEHGLGAMRRVTQSSAISRTAEHGGVGGKSKRLRTRKNRG